MSVRQYIGARYVPVFSDPIQWDSTISYEPLTVVMNQGTSYVSKQSVPTGIEITNETYWLRWADYNAQLEEYIRQVQQYNARIQQNADDIDALEGIIPKSDFSSALTVKDYIDALGEIIPSSDFTSLATVKDYIDAIGEIIPTTDFSSSSTIKDAIDAINARFPIATSDIANGAVTQGKIANNSITLLKNSYKHMVVIGDSFSTTTYNPIESAWYTIVSKTLGLTVHNYSRDSAGYVKVGAGSTTFMTEAERAVADTDYENSDVKLVIVYGGLNDMGTDYVSNLNTNADALYAYLKTNFQNALVVIFGINHWPSGLWINPNTNSTTANYSYSLSIQAKNNACVYIPIWHLMYDSNLFNPSHNHPNEAGNEFTASIMLNLLFGTTVGAYNEVTKSGSDANSNTYTVSMRLLNNEIYYYGRYNLVGSDTATIIPPNNLYTASMSPVQGIPTTSGTNLCGFFHSDPDTIKNGFIGHGTQGRDYFFRFSIPILG